MSLVFSFFVKIRHGRITFFEFCKITVDEGVDSKIEWELENCENEFKDKVKLKDDINKEEAVFNFKELLIFYFNRDEGYKKTLKKKC